MKIQLTRKDHEKLKEEIVSLRKEVDQLNKNLKSSQFFDDILNCQRSPLDKYGLGYIGVSSCKSDVNPKASNNKNVEKLESCVNAPRSSISKERSQNNIGRTYAPKIYVHNVKNSSSIKYH